MYVRPTGDPAAAAKASGLISAGGSIITLFAVPFWGVTSDAIGRKPVILVGLLGNAVAYGLVGLIPSTISLIVGVAITRITVATVTVCEFTITIFKVFSPTVSFYYFFSYITGKGSITDVMARKRRQLRREQRQQKVLSTGSKGQQSSGAHASADRRMNNSDDESISTIHSLDTDDPIKARAISQARALRVLYKHLREWRARNPDETFTAWIASVHPENVQLDPRMNIEENPWKLVWEAEQEHFVTKNARAGESLASTPKVSPADPTVRIGDRVMVTDGDDEGRLWGGEGDGWGGGVVVAIVAGWPVVRRDGWDEDFEWEYYRKALSVEAPPSDFNFDSGYQAPAAAAVESGNVDTVGEEALGPVQTRRWPRPQPAKIENTFTQGPSNDMVEPVAKNTPSSAPRDEVESDVYAASSLTRNFARVGAIKGFTFLFGPLSAGWLISYTGNTKLVCLLVSGLDFLAFFIVQYWMKETIQKRTPNIACSQINPFPALKIFGTSSAIGALLVPHILADAARCVHSILFLYLIVKFQWTPIHIGAFFTAVGIKTVITQALILPCMIPRYMSVRLAVPVGTFIAGFEYALYGVCTQGWAVVTVLFACSIAGLEGASLDSLFSSQVPSQKQGRLSGAMTVVNTFTHALMVPFFCFLFARCLGGRNPMDVAHLALANAEEKEDDTPERRSLINDGLPFFRTPEALLNLSLVALSNRSSLVDLLPNISMGESAAIVDMVPSTHAWTLNTTLSPIVFDHEIPSTVHSLVQSSDAYAGEGQRSIPAAFFNGTKFDLANMHLEAPFFVSSALFYAASLSAICVLHCFPSIGRAINN